MDDQLIYVRTPAGEEAMQQRTRLIQRNLRRVLDTVDGWLPVADIKGQIGDSRMADDSLAELERLGLIEELSTREAREKRQGAVKTASNDFLFADPGSAAMPMAAPSDRGGTPQVGGRVPGEESVSRRPPPTTLVPADDPPSEPVAAKAQGLLVGLRGKFFRWRQKQKVRNDEKAFRRAYETLTDEDSFAPIKLRPIRRGPRRVITGPGRLVRGLLLLAGGALLLAMLFPYGRYRPEIERRLGAALGDQVRIAELRFSFLPYPNITLQGVSVGVEPYAEAKSIRVIPELFSLFGSHWVIRHVQLEDLMIRRLGITPSARWFASAPGRKPALLLRHGQVNRLSVEIADGRLDGLGGEVVMRAEGGVEKILLQNAERSLQLEVMPAAVGYQLSVVGNALKMPFKPNLIFDYIAARGEISSGLLSIQKIDGRLYGGIIDGTAQFDWARALVLSADIGLARASASSFMAALDPDLSLEGNIGGKFRIESRANDLAQLSDNLRIHGEFLAERGVINRFDFMAAVRSSLPSRGGYTRFEKFSGALQLDRNTWHLGQLKIDSGLMQAAGNLDIGADRQLKGLMELDLKGSATRLNASVQIAGTLTSPQLSSIRSARR